MNRKLKKAIGWGILGTLFAGVFGYMAAASGFWVALGVWAVAFCASGLVYLGAWLAWS
jgi:hypothetical protein